MRFSLKKGGSGTTYKYLTPKLKARATWRLWTRSMSGRRVIEPFWLCVVPCQPIRSKGATWEDQVRVGQGCLPKTDCFLVRVKVGQSQEEAVRAHPPRFAREQRPLLGSQSTAGESTSESRPKRASAPPSHMMLMGSPLRL